MTDSAPTPYWAELVDVCGGDDGLARSLHDSLHRLAAGPAGSPLTDLANEVLDGRLGLRAAVGSSSYATPLLAAAQQFTAWHDRLSPDDRAELLRRGADLTRSAAGSVDGEPPTA
jgi:hypothetical protein